MKSEQDICKQAAEIARAEVLKHCKAVKLTPRRTLKRIAEALDAKENKVFYDKDLGECIVGPAMIDWSARAKAIDQAIAILDIKPAEKHEVTVGGIETILERIHGGGNIK